MVLQENAQEINRHFIKEDIQMMNMIRELQIRNTIRYHCMLTRMAHIKKTDNTKCW